jgi:hypothetical protein
LPGNDHFGSTKYGSQVLAKTTFFNFIIRDLALRNVLATKRGEGKYLVKVSDFGMRFGLRNVGL